MKRRFWHVYNVAVLAVVVLLGIMTMEEGGTSRVVLGGLMILVAAYVATRTVRGSRSRPQVQVVSELRFDEHGITVVAGRADAPGTARLAWDDCVALVASAAGHPDARGVYYLHFMPRHDDAVDLVDVPSSLLRQKAAIVDLPATRAVAMVWLCTRDTLPRLLEVVDQVRATRPHVRVVDSIGRGVGG